MKNTLRFLILALVWSLAASVRAADIYVVVAADNTHWQGVSQKDVVALYMGRSRTLPTGDAVTVFDLPNDSPVREVFYSALTGMTPAQVNSYWSRLIFTGRTLPPPSVANEQAMVDKLRRTPNAVGYLSRTPSDPALRTLLVLRSTAND